MTLQAKLDSWGIRHFTASEIIENTGKVPPKDLWDNIHPTLLIADQMREDWGQSLSVTSGYRSIDYNTEAAHNGSLTNSAHQDFNALDLKFYGADPMVFVAWADAWLRKRGKQVAVQKIKSVRVTYADNGQPDPNARIPCTYGKHIRHGVYGRESNKMFLHIDTAPLIGGRGMEWSAYGGKADVRATNHPEPNPGTPTPPQDIIEAIPDGVAQTVPTTEALKKDEQNEGAEGEQAPLKEESRDVIFNDDELDKGSPFTLNQYLTPEELRKGIISKVFRSQDWHLHQLAEDQQNEGQTYASEESAAIRAEQSLDPAQRYVFSLVEAEFYRRRFATRQVPAVTGPFNPYVVPGFPGLVLDPARPIIGQVVSVTHTFEVAAGQANTSVSFRSPRYWDEGEVYHWMGGWSGEDMKTKRGVQLDDNQEAVLYRRFPQWHNRHAVATNHYTDQEDYQNRQNRRKTRLDRFYQFYLGVDAVDYMSNHWDKVDDPKIIEKSIKERDPGPFDVSPVTLDIQEYNRMIAEKDDEGKFAPWTLAHKFWGHTEPKTEGQTEVPIDEGLDYAERYGVRERELMVDFLDNTPHTTEDGHMVYAGPSFGTESGVKNPQQQQIMEYIDDMDRRDIGGGTT